MLAVMPFLAGFSNIWYAFEAVNRLCSGVRSKVLEILTVPQFHQMRESPNTASACALGLPNSSSWIGLGQTPIATWPCVLYLKQRRRLAKVLPMQAVWACPCRSRLGSAWAMLTGWATSRPMPIFYAVPKTPCIAKQTCAPEARQLPPPHFCLKEVVSDVAGPLN